MRALVVGERNVSEKAVRLFRCDVRQGSGSGRQGTKRQSGSAIRSQERVCFHASTRRPDAQTDSTTVANCRSKIALPARLDDSESGVAARRPGTVVMNA